MTSTPAPPSGAPGAGFAQQSGFPGQPAGSGSPAVSREPRRSRDSASRAVSPGSGCRAGFGQPVSGGFPAQPNTGFPPHQPDSGLRNRDTASRRSRDPAAARIRAAGRPPQPAFGQPVQPQPAFGQTGQAQPAFGQPPAAPVPGDRRSSGSHGVRAARADPGRAPGRAQQSPSEAFGTAERTQVVKPAGEPEATQMIKPETPEPGPAQS
ncbi:hypothetical protein ACFPN7_49010 [Amycolatopsis halotolerans]|uniref:hypothetical protein n=1 Tax=Amycolatopsis halotolerans TaxID=330083 RepID=UPI003610461B